MSQNSSQSNQSNRGTSHDNDMDDIHVDTLDKQVLSHYFKNLQDIQITEKTYDIKGQYTNKQATLLLIYSDCMISQSSLIDFVLPSIEEVLSKIDRLTEQTLQNKLTMNWEVIASETESITLHRLSSFIFEGDLIVFVKEAKTLLSVTIPALPSRQPSDAAAETSIRGPRDGLVEDLSQNLALIRKRIRSVHLVCKTYTLGHLTNTKVALLYLDNKVNEQVRQTVEHRLENINVEALLTAGELEEVISESHLYSFPLLDHSGRPDFLSQNLIEGRFVLLTDNNPVALIGPGKITSFLRSPEDRHFPVMATNIGILIRCISLFITIFLPSFYIAITTFHPDQIPFQLLATIGNSRVGLPLEAPIELFLIMFLMEMFREATFRMPSSIGQTVTVVGGLIIGESAINAGLVSPIIVVVAALTIVASASLINQSLTSTAVLLRFIFFFISSILGMFGFILCIFTLVIIFSQLKSFGVPYAVILTPPNWRKLLKSFFQVPNIWLPSTRKHGDKKDDQ